MVMVKTFTDASDMKVHGKLPSATKLRLGNVFTPVCHSVHGEGVFPYDLQSSEPVDFQGIFFYRFLYGRIGVLKAFYC